MNAHDNVFGDSAAGETSFNLQSRNTQSRQAKLRKSDKCDEISRENPEGFKLSTYNKFKHTISPGLLLRR